VVVEKQQAERHGILFGTGLVEPEIGDHVSLALGAFAQQITLRKSFVRGLDSLGCRPLLLLTLAFQRGPTY
jgi:hypothetical protein